MLRNDYVIVVTPPVAVYRYRGITNSESEQNNGTSGWLRSERPTADFRYPFVLLIRSEVTSTSLSVIRKNVSKKTGNDYWKLILGYVFSMWQVSDSKYVRCQLFVVRCQLFEVGCQLVDVGCRNSLRSLDPRINNWSP